MKKMTPIEIVGIVSPIILLLLLYVNGYFASLCYDKYAKIARVFIRTSRLCSSKYSVSKFGDT